MHEVGAGDKYSRRVEVAEGGTIKEKGVYTGKKEEGVKIGELEEEFI